MRSIARPTVQQLVAAAAAQELQDREDRAHCLIWIFDLLARICFAEYETLQSRCSIDAPYRHLDESVPEDLLKFSVYFAEPDLS